MTKGLITLRYEVECATCDARLSAELSHGERAAGMAAVLWGKHWGAPTHGWQCPDCLAKERGRGKKRKVAR